MKSLSSFLCLFSLCYAADTSPQKDIELLRYQGRWYEQARFENWFERDMDSVYTDYTLSPDNTLLVLNRGVNQENELRQSKGKAVPLSDGILGVSFVWPYRWFRAPYHILYVDPDYTAALVSGRDEAYLWLLTRERTPRQATIDKLIQEAERRGFDTSKLRCTRQSPD